MTQADRAVSPPITWSRLTTILLLCVGMLLGAASLGVVYSMGGTPWHGARAAELDATYTTYLKTGVLLIKPTGSGSYGVQAPTPGPLAAAAWDDDPGSYIVASLLGPLTRSDSPYPGLMLTQGFLIAIPLLFLPLTIARVFRRPAAGYALAALPLVLWLTNHGAVLVGTEYGLSDEVSSLPVYALYGIAASLAFLSLSLLLFLSTWRLKLWILIGLTLLFGVLGGFGNLFRGLSGFGIALAVGVLWWLNTSKKWRLIFAATAGLSAVLIASLVQGGVMAAINAARVEATGQSIEEIPSAHAVWHSMYMGLSYPTQITGEPSRFGVLWSDEYGWEKAREVDPDVVIASEEYDSILKDLYWEKVTADPLGAVGLYLEKFRDVVIHFGLMILVILGAFIVGIRRTGPQRRQLRAALALAVPTLILGLVPPVLVMPQLYYYSELSAALGLLIVVSIGVVGWLVATRLTRAEVPASADPTSLSRQDSTPPAVGAQQQD